MGRKTVMVKKIHKAIRKEKQKIFRAMAKDLFEQPLWERIKTALLILRG